MAYSIPQLEDLFSELRKLAPAVSFVRTETRTFPDGATRREAVLDKAPRRDTIVLSEIDVQYRSAISRLATFLGLSRSDAERAYRLLDALHALNPVGAWCLEPTPLESGVHLSDGSSTPHRFLDEVIADLAELLPGVESIVPVSHVVKTSQGFTRRRVCLRFRADARHELAALDTAHFSVHLTSLLIGEGEHTERNRQRAEVWAHQLGIDIEDMPSLLHDLSLVFVALPTTELKLSSRYRGVDPARRRQGA